MCVNASGLVTMFPPKLCLYAGGVLTNSAKRLSP